MKKILIACVFLIAFSAQGQGGLVLDNLGMAEGGGALLRNKVLERKKEKIEGTPYLNEVFMSSSISGADNLFVTRYNAYNDEVEISHDGSIFVIPKVDKHNTIVNKSFDYILKLIRYNAGGENYVYGYLFELFTTENMGLYQRQQIVLQEAREAANSYSTAIPAKYIKKSTEHYLMMGENKVMLFPKNKKALTSLFSGKEEKITDYLKSEKISFKEEEDLIKLTKFLATL
jgi:hypothetical protein